MAAEQTHSKLITVWDIEPPDRRLPYLSSLATCFIEQKQPVVIAQIGDTSSHGQDTAQWVSQFSGLAPAMLRNYLAGPYGSYARLPLVEWPPLPILNQLCELLRKTFAWTFILTPPDFTTAGLTVLDASDLVLSIPYPKTNPQSLLKHRDTLASHHYPVSLLKIIAVGENSIAWPDPLAHIPDLPPYTASYKEAIAQLAHRLQNEPALYVPRQQRPCSPQPMAIVQTLKTRIQPQLLKALEQPGPSTAEAGPCRGLPSPAEIAQRTIEEAVAQDPTLPTSREARQEIVSQVMHEVLGLGPIEPLLKDPDVSEVMVNGKGSIFVEKHGKLFPTAMEFSSEAQLRTIIDRIVAPIGRRVDESMPLCDARLTDGSRVNIVLPPLALDGAVVTIRKFMARKLGLMDLVPLNSLTQEMADFLRVCVLLRKNIVVSGGTGSGKTTLLNALSSQIPDDERIVTIEDAAELRLQKPHVVRLESRPPNAEGEGAIPIRRLVINALRMRPDRIVVGECRGGEALDMLQAMNTGHDGSLTTLHANTPRDALGRLETLVLMAGMDLPVRVIREQIRSAVHLLIQQTRLPDGSRKITSITEVTGMEGETLTTQELFRYQDDFEATGIMPTFIQEIKSWES